MSIIYKKGSLFEAPKGSILVHSCNAQGVWGKGIAAEFKKRFPASFKFYKEICNEEKERLIGTVIFCPEENDYLVDNLITSVGYGINKDSKETILKNTKLALQSLLYLESELKLEIHSNKFNSGLFGVKWELTEKILLEVMKEIGYTLPWTVWEL